MCTPLARASFPMAIPTRFARAVSQRNARGIGSGLAIVVDAEWPVRHPKRRNTKPRNRLRIKVVDAADELDLLFQRHLGKDGGNALLDFRLRWFCSRPRCALCCRAISKEQQAQSKFAEGKVDSARVAISSGDHGTISPLEWMYPAAPS